MAVPRVLALLAQGLPAHPTSVGLLPSPSGSWTTGKISLELLTLGVLSHGKITLDFLTLRVLSHSKIILCLLTLGVLSHWKIILNLLILWGSVPLKNHPGLADPLCSVPLQKSSWICWSFGFCPT